MIGPRTRIWRSTKNWIAGEWIAGSDASSNVNPSDLDDTIGEYARADRHQVDVAIRAAAHALRSWRDAGILLRSEVLDRAGANSWRKNELGELLSREEGKTRVEGAAKSRARGTFSNGSLARPCVRAARCSSPFAPVFQSRLRASRSA